MADSEGEKFVTQRHPTLGDAAGRHVPELGSDAVPIAQPHVTPLMQDAFIGRRTARAMILVFLLIIIIPGVWALCTQFRPNSPMVDLLRHGPTTQTTAALSREMLDQSPSSRLLKRTWGLAYTRASGDPLGNVLIGRDGCLFYRDDYDLCVGEGILVRHLPVVVSSIVQYSRDLQKRGIHFIVMPVPAKTAIMPRKLWPAYPVSMGPALNRDYRQWIQMLRSQGVDVLDLTDDFWKMSVDGQAPYMSQDTHWTPEAMQLAADELARRIQPFLGDHPRLNLTAQNIEFSTQGDLVDLMGDKGDDKNWPPMQLHLTRVLEDGKPVVAGDEAHVLLLGDSYTQVFTDPEFYPIACGLPQHLMLNLGAHVQYISGYGKRFSQGREILAEHPETLKNKRVVVWEFTSRVLPSSIVPLPPEQ